MSKIWTACISRTGYELFSIIKNIGIVPNQIICNSKPNNNIICKELFNILKKNKKEITFVSKIPTVEEYFLTFQPKSNHIITCHGWMRIIPSEICREFNIYNGHPGLITEYPELKGKDPQEKAFKGSYKTVGGVIHKVTEIVDDGEVICSFSINNNFKTLEDMSNSLRDFSIKMWSSFLKKELFPL